MLSSKVDVDVIEFCSEKQPVISEPAEFEVDFHHDSVHPSLLRLIELFFQLLTNCLVPRNNRLQSETLPLR
jgi:hypothetical protein